MPILCYFYHLTGSDKPKSRGVDQSQTPHITPLMHFELPPYVGASPNPPPHVGAPSINHPYQTPITQHLNPSPLPMHMSICIGLLKMLVHCELY